MCFAGIAAYELPCADAIALVGTLSWDPTPKLWYKACAPGSWTACCAIPGVAAADDKIAATARSLNLVIFQSFQVVDPVRRCVGHLTEGLGSDWRYSRGCK